MSRASSWTRVFVCHLAAVAAGAHAAAAQEGESAEMEELARAIHTSAFTALPAALQLPQPTRAFAVNVDSTALHWSSTWLDDRSQMAAASMGTPAASIEGSVEASGIPTAEELLAAYQVCQGAADRPRTLSDLTGGYQLYQSSYREDFAASLGLLGIADLSGRRSAIVVRYHLFRMVRRSCSINSVEIPVVWGVGVASTLHVKEARRGARVTSLPVIAASVEFGHASVTMRMETAGLVGAAIE
ncbi:MAG TPA: hypothetical protein VFR37_03095, partial [Longimicrobium sp.]|nr:hypothetical protein [Longimicrobium sp.]